MNCDSSEDHETITSPIYEIFKINPNPNGSQTVFLGLERLHNTIDNPITCTLCPRRSKPGYFCEVFPQFGCDAHCNFCKCWQLPDGGETINLTAEEVMEQFRILRDIAVNKVGLEFEAVNKVSFSDGGELLNNPDCMEILSQLRGDSCSPNLVKISTVLPSNSTARDNLGSVFGFMQGNQPEVTLQVSLSSTNERMRNAASRTPLLSFEELQRLGDRWLKSHPRGRKITLTFTLTSRSHVIPDEIAGILTPNIFRIRLHPFKRHADPNERIQPISDDDHALCEAAFRAVGYGDLDAERYSVEDKKQLITGGSDSLRSGVKQGVGHVVDLPHIS